MVSKEGFDQKVQGVVSEYIRAGLGGRAGNGGLWSCVLFVKQLPNIQEHDTAGYTPLLRLHLRAHQCSFYD